MRAAVMGANDGIVSVAGIVVGVAAASSSNGAILLSGFAGMIAGTVSMAMGEYVSVNTEKDSQRHAVMQEKNALDTDYDTEAHFVQEKYEQTGIDSRLAAQATSEMMAQDPLKTMVRERFGFNVNEYTNPYAAAIASMLSFPTGSCLPMLAVWLFPGAIKIPATFIAVVIALAITGYIAAALGHSNRAHGVWRNMVAGILTMTVTFLIGHLIGG
ncbi:VIT1/CCC1 transporter family protein [Lactobacillus selangorensis]|nr:VIT family protein [Lactobacillus selangorensis]